jgi:hypothetical protein
MAEEQGPAAESLEDYRRRLAQNYYTQLRQNAPRQSYGVGGVADLANNIQQAQAQHLQGAANNVMSAHANEMQSRVSQAREMRRMQHEKDLMRMRSEADIYGAAIRALMG